ncbi:DNA-binding CsgD family transcriptional regulator [Crossiella equi]|uniref:DNA-binding CsgD family transcriptional regulator n=1 Tax=Crossiella equi TaxID=130796 RepID=A0ABS5ALT9_9PSEU|nr:LuxR family transcriptional regulator [Crossiella equi]MBP2477540.1 DNA-binding CsgD family transcriptional regulator [Crossiella equi]
MASPGARRIGLNVDALRAVEETPAGPHRQPEHTPPGNPGHVDGLGPHAAAVAVAVAVLGPQAPLRGTAELAGLSLPDTLAAVDVLTAAGVLVNAVPLSLRPPHTSAQVLSGLSVGARVTVRLRAAEQLRHVPGAAERVADQLVDIGPAGLDWAAEALDLASAHALDRGDRDAAAHYLRHALAEPVAPAERLGRTQRLADMLVGTDPVGAVTALLQELRRSDTPAEVGDTALLLRGLATRTQDTPELIRLFDEAADRLREHDGQAAASLQVTRAGFALFRTHGAARLTKLERWLGEHAPDDPPSRRGLAVVRACLHALREPRAGQAVELATRALAEAGPGEWDTSWLALSALLLAGEDTLTEQAYLRLVAELPTEVVGLPRLACELTRARCQRRRGRLREAAATLEDVLVESRRCGLPRHHGVVVTAAANLAELLVRRGDLDRAEQLLAEHHLLAEELAETIAALSLLRARGALSAARGDLDGALADQLECGRLVTAWAELNADFLPWRHEAVTTLLRAGRHGEAVALAEADVAAAQAWDTARARGFAAYALAVTSRDERRVELLTEAVALLHEAGAALEEAQAHHDLAFALRRVRREPEAAVHLVAAAQLAAACGAAPFGEHLPTAAAAEEGRPALTPQERRIARLVAQGRSNTEIAEELALARRTVEFHLSGVYRKLGITGRRELAHWAGLDDD